MIWYILGALLMCFVCIGVLMSSDDTDDPFDSQPSPYDPD